MFAHQEHNLGELQIVDVYLARESARRGDRDEVIPLMRAPSTICSARDSCWAVRLFWWRPCWIAGLTKMWPKPRP